MFTFNFTFHVPNPFSMSTLTSVASAATDAFNSVATDIREDPELLNYMVAGIGPGGVAGGFGYDLNRLTNSPLSSSTSFSSPTSPRSKGLKSSHNRHTVGLGLANPHAHNRKRHPPGHERSRPDFQGSTSGFVYVNPPPGSGTPRSPTQVFSQPSSGSYLNSEIRRPLQGTPMSNRPIHPLPESRKRGWVPALSEPSYASANEDFTTGFFDTPRYSDANEMGGVVSKPAVGLEGLASGVGDRRKRGNGHESEGEDEVDAELPPAKRRKGLAGSVLSAAVSAALIGTAVGLTMYRLWKDRGRPDSTPPPPYEESERSHHQTHDSKTLPAHIYSESALANVRTQRRRHAASAGRRTAGGSVRYRKPIPQKFHPVAYNQLPEQSQPVQAQYVSPGPGPFDFQFERVEEVAEEEPEDQMDWIGDRISQLIQEGKKALGAEVVVMSDSKEDEVDDGSGLWEDSDGGEFGSFISSRHGRSSPRRTRARRSLLHQSIPGGLGSEFSPPTPPAYDLSTNATFPGSPSMVQSAVEPASLNSSTSSTTGWVRESENDWQSEQMKESMERARAVYLAKRKGQTVSPAY